MAARKTKREDGRYQCSLVIGRNEQGKLIRKYFYGKSQREANAKKKAYQDGLVVSPDAKSTTVKAWSEKWLKNYATGGYRNKANTESILRKFNNYIGHKTISDVRQVDIQEYAKSQAKFTKSHVGKVKRTLTNMFDAAKANDLVLSNPTMGVVWDSVKTGSHEMLSRELIELLTNNWMIHSAGIWAMFMLYAGLRPSEAFALKRENIVDGMINVKDGSHFEHGQLVIVEGQVKTEAGLRSVPLVRPLEAVLEACPETGFMCRTADGRPVSEAAARSNWSTLWNMLEEVYNGRIPHKAGRRSDKFPEDWKYLPKVQMYDLRHTYCSMLYEADVDVKTAQYLMGHASLDMTLKIYTHLSEIKKKRSYDKLKEYFEK